MRWPLQRKLFVIVGAGAAVLTLGMSLVVNLTVVEEVQQHEDRSLAHTQAAFEALQRHRRELLLERCRLVSELPYFKAAVSVYDPELPQDRQDQALATVSDVARRILERIDVDLLTLTSGDGTPIFAVGPAVERGRPDETALAALARHAMRHMASDGFVAVGKDLVYVTAVQVEVGGLRLGALCLGTTLDSELANSLEDMTGSAVLLLGVNDVYAQSHGVPPEVEDELRSHLAGVDPPQRRELLEVGGARYRSLWLPFQGPDEKTLGAFVVLRSETDALAFLSAIRKGLLIIASVAVAMALAFSFLFARHLTVPLRDLVAFTERLGRGDLATRVTVGTHDELALLGDSFNRMATGLSDSRSQLEDSNRTLAQRGRELESTNADLRRSQEEAERVNRALQEAHAQVLQAGKMAAFGELGAGIAHDLKQPLAAIRGFAQLIERRLRPEDQEPRRHVGLIVQSVDHMAEIVQGLRDFARRSSFTFRGVDVNEVVERTCLLLSGPLRSSRVRLVKNLGAGLPQVHGDPNQLQQVVTNLLANARDALETTGGTVTVRTERADGGSTVMISVEDDGPGIPTENLSKIFGSFFTTKPEGKGTGLGLAITQAIVQDHGGRIDVQSRPRQATVFRVFLPVRDALGDGEPGIEDLPRAA